MTFHLITIFPRIFDSYFSESILKRAQEKKLIKIKVHNLRDWTEDKHKTVDDAPYGGGAGMIMKVEPIFRALQALKFQIPITKSQTSSKSQIPNHKHGSKILNHKSKIVLLSAKGKTWNQQLAKKYSKLDNLILICGRYEGVDERVKKFIDGEISIGNYVLTGGEIPAMAIIDSITRLLPGVLGNKESIKHESHSKPSLLEYSQYTRPEVFTAPLPGRGKRGLKPLSDKVKIKSYRVPKILLSGNHKKIDEWRRKNPKQRKK